MHPFSNIPQSKVEIEMPFAKPFKRKKAFKAQFVKNQAKSDSFWKRKFMQVLEAMHDSELTWAREYWSFYGISDHEAKIIEREFERQVEWRAKRDGKLANNQ
jgi:hypothetical protein